MNPDDDMGNEAEQSDIDMNRPAKRRRTAGHPGAQLSIGGSQIPDSNTLSGTPSTGGALSIGGSQIPDPNSLRGMPPTRTGPSNTDLRISGQINTPSGRTPGALTAGGMSNTDRWIFARAARRARREVVQLTIVRAYDLHNLRRIGIMNPSAVMYLDGANTAFETTAIHFHGGTNPVWNDTFDFRSSDLYPSRTGNLNIAIYDMISPDDPKLVGTAQVPVRDFARRNLSRLWDRESFAYQVWTPDLGRYHGMLYVKIRRVREAAPAEHAPEHAEVAERE